MRMNSIPADYKLSQSGRTIIFQGIGDWTREHAQAIDGRLISDLSDLDYDDVNYDFSNVTNLDTAGAYLFARALGTHENMYKLSLIHI